MCSKGLFCALALFLAGACTIKEDRTGCPCRLVIGVQGGVPPYYLLLTQGDESVRDTLFSGSAAFEQTVVRRPLQFRVYCSDASLFVPGWGLTIPPGQDCPPFWSAVRSIVADGERQAEIITLHKNHCRVSLVFKMEGKPVRAVPFQLMIRGTVAGYDLEDKPVTGIFQYAPQPDADGVFTFGLPRQSDTSLQLEIRDSDGILRSFPLGDYIAQGGYDWAAPDLADLPMEIDYARTQVTFRMALWEKTVQLKMVI